MELCVFYLIGLTVVSFISILITDHSSSPSAKGVSKIKPEHQSEDFNVAGKATSRQKPVLTASHGTSATIS